MRFFYPWASQLFAEIKSRLDITEFHIPLGDAPIQSQALCRTLLLLFTTAWKLFVGLSPLPPRSLLHRFSVPCSPLVVFGACSRLSLGAWKKQNFRSAVMLTGSFCLPFRPISLTSCVSLHSSPAMQCFQTISMRTKSECYRPLVYKPAQETIPIISEPYFFGLFHVLWLSIKHFPVSTCLSQVDDGPHCDVLSLILTNLLREGILRKQQRWKSIELCTLVSPWEHFHFPQ